MRVKRELQELATRWTEIHRDHEQWKEAGVPESDIPHEIASSIQATSQDVLQVEEGSLYPALQRMLIKGWVTAEWGVTSGNRRARYYRITRLGRKRLATEVLQFDRVIGAIQRVLQAG